MSAFDNPSLAIAFAIAAGTVSVALASHLRIPSIVLLLLTGVLLGPDVAGVIRPESLGPALLTLVGFAVAVILFDGGMNLNIGRLRREQRSIRQLVTIGALITAVGGTLAARLILGWDWRLSVMFGTLVIVTGPTVVTPLLRRLKVERTVGTVLEAEGVLVDAVGAITAVVALEVALSPSGREAAAGLVDVLARLGFGAGFGLGAGLVLALMLRVRYLVPEGLENIFVLGMVFAVFQGANAMMHESGIAAVVIAGMVVGNSRTPVQHELLEFKEQLSVLFIGMLFVLLAADVRLSQIEALGFPGLLVCVVLMVLVRPACVWVSTLGSSFDHRQKLFMGWIGPRGIVAAAVASFFAAELERAGVEGGTELRAMVFMVIAVTVVTAGLTGGFVARLLGLRRKMDDGWVILGANDMARALARALRSHGDEVVVIDTNTEACHQAEEEGLRVVWSNGLEERTLHRALIDTRKGALGVTPNDEVNLLFAQKVRRAAKLRRVYVAIGLKGLGVTDDMVDQAGAQTLFGRKLDFDGWSVRLRHKQAVASRWVFNGKEPMAANAPAFQEGPAHLFLPMAVFRSDGVWPVTAGTSFRKNDEVAFLINQERAGEALAWLSERKWVRLDTSTSDDWGSSRPETLGDSE